MKTSLVRTMVHYIRTTVYRIYVYTNASAWLCRPPTGRTIDYTTPSLALTERFDLWRILLLHYYIITNERSIYYYVYEGILYLYNPIYTCVSFIRALLFTINIITCACNNIIIVKHIYNCIHGHVGILLLLRRY